MFSCVTGTMGGLGLGRFSPRALLVVMLIAPQVLLSERGWRSFALMTSAVKFDRYLSVIY